MGNRLGILRAPLERRLKAFVDLDELENPGGCWNWTGGKNKLGYGHFKVDYVTRRAHVIAYELFIGPVPEGLLVLHKCNNPSCVNPRHLMVGTQAENLQQAVAEGRINFKGELNNASKLTEEQVREIRFGVTSGVEMAAKFNVSKQNVCDIRKGRSWRHVY